MIQITSCTTDGELRSLLNEEPMMDILQMVGYRGVLSKETLNSSVDITRYVNFVQSYIWDTSDIVSISSLVKISMTSLPIFSCSDQ